MNKGRQNPQSQKIDRQQIDQFLEEQINEKQYQDQSHENNDIQDRSNIEGFNFSDGIEVPYEIPLQESQSHIPRNSLPPEEIIDQKQVLKEQKKSIPKKKKKKTEKGAKDNQSKVNQQGKDNKNNIIQSSTINNLNIIQNQQEKHQQKNKIQNIQESTSTIVFHAHMERIGTIYSLYGNYIKKYERHLRSHEAVLHNICVEIQRKKKYKMVPSYIIREYFQQVINLQKKMHQQCYKIKTEAKGAQSIININQKIKNGLQQLVFLRKQLGNQCLNYCLFIREEIINKITKLFGDYEKKVSEGMLKVQTVLKVYTQAEKDFRKKVEKIEKVYEKGKSGINQDEDVFVEIVKFIKSEQTMQEGLNQWGFAIIDFRKQFISEEQILFEELQKILNNYKNHTKTVKYGSKNEFAFGKVMKMQGQVKEQNEFQKLCVLTDVDYIKFVMQQKGVLTNKIFEQFFSLKYFHKHCGDASSFLKGTISKSFPLKEQKEQLINTISGNLIHFDQKNITCKDKFAIKNISVKIVGQAIVEIDETVKGIIFNSNRTVRFTLKDHDRAEQLITLLTQSTVPNQQ